MEAMVLELQCSVAARMLGGARRLRSIIEGTTTARGMLVFTAEWLREAARGAENLADYAFDQIPANAAPPLHVEVVVKLFAASMFDGPLPGSISAARRIFGHLSGVLPSPPAEYQQIFQCGGNLAGLTSDIFSDVWCRFLTITQGSPKWQRWRALANYSTTKSANATARLATIDMHATEVSRNLHNLCRFWEDPLEADDTSRAKELSSTEVNLQDAMNLMDEALVSMHQMDDFVMLMYYEIRA